MTILAPPVGFDVTRPIRDRITGHPELQRRCAELEPVLTDRGLKYLELEFFRYNARQQYLFGAGRGPNECMAHDVPLIYARPHELKVTNAWSSDTSAHGYTLVNASGALVPAAAAVDIVPLGPDGKPFTNDDPWDEFLAICAEEAENVGLVHFAMPHRPIWDKPHLALVEWNDATCRLDLPNPFVANGA